jgi:tetratricopeptide (TPR) repeat protein
VIEPRIEKWRVVIERKTMTRILLVLVLAAAGNLAAAKQIPQTAVPSAPKAQQLNQRALDFFVAALVAEGSGDVPSATILYDSAWRYCPTSAEIGVAYAQTLLYARRIPEALDALQRIAPPTSEQMALIAYCYRQLGENDRTRDAYLQLLTLDTTQSAAYMFLGGYYQQRNDADSTLWALRNLARTMPENYQIQNELGKAYLAKENLNEAKEAFRRSLELAPIESNMDALLNLADIYERRKQADSVEALLSAASLNQPENAFLHRELSRIYLEKDSVTQALPHLWAAARLDSSDYTAQRRLAIVLIATDSLNAADSILTQLLRSGDSEPANHFYLGRVAALRKDFYRARDEFLMLTERAPSIPDGWLSLAFTYRQLQQPEEEIETYQRALVNITDENYAVQLYFALGAAFEQQGKIDSAVATLETLLEHRPEHGPSLNYLGYMLADRGIRLDYARGLLERALKLEPKNAAYLDSYGWVFYRLGMFKDAVKYLKMAVELDSDPVIYDHLGDALQATGKTKQAREWWQKALEQLPNNETIKQKLQR